MRIRPIWTFPLIALATTGALFTANAVTAGSNKPAAAPYTLSNDGNNAAAETDASATPAALSVQTDPALGKIVIDGKGWTVYRFDKDTVKPPASNCDGDCATTWPPVPASDSVQLKGVSKALVGKVTRKDGTEQMTLGGWPLYRYSKDTAPGDTNGQGVGGTWFVAAPTGGKAGATATATEAPATDPPVTETPAPAPAETTKPAAPAKSKWAGWTILKAVKDPKLGWIVVDKKGWTLYRFDKDTVKPSVSNCLGACAKLWPPVKATDKIKLTGVDKSLVKSIMRKDGVCQLTLGGWPLYRYAKDVTPGDTNGQGVGGVWFASTPEGKKAGVAAAPAAGSGQDNSGSGGYGY